MKIIFLLAFQILPISAQATIFAVKVVEEGVKGAKDIKMEFNPMEQLVWEKAGLKCKLIGLGSKVKPWGIFRCDHTSGLEVSSRFSCERDKSFENSRQFRVAKKNEFNTTFSFWCEK